MERPLGWLTLASAVGTGVLGGVYFGFTFVMKGLSRLEPARGVAAMQAIDKAIVSPPFLLVFVGTGLTSAALIVTSAFRWDEPGAKLQLLGGLAGLAAVGVTAIYHVPRNDALQLLDPGTAEATRFWDGYVPGWVAWNHVRTATSVAAAAVLTVAYRALAAGS